MRAPPFVLPLRAVVAACGVLVGCTACESIVRDIADHGDPSHLGAFAHTLEKRDARGALIPSGDPWDPEGDR